MNDLGVRLSLVLGAVIGVMARSLLASSCSLTMAMLVLYTLPPGSHAFGIPIMTIGAKWFTHSSNRT